jgi:hypothetical protein
VPGDRSDLLAHTAGVEGRNTSTAQRAHRERRSHDVALPDLPALAELGIAGYDVGT